MDFFNNEDLTDYNNWSGRCNITYKTIRSGENGWIRDLAGEGESPIAAWGIYTNADEDEEAPVYYPFNYGAGFAV